MIRYPSPDIRQTVYVSYPELVNFIENNCVTCSNNCMIPSVNIFACVMKKIANKGKFRDKEKEEDSNEKTEFNKKLSKKDAIEHKKNILKEPTTTDEFWNFKKETKTIYAKDTNTPIIKDQIDLNGIKIIVTPNKRRK